MRKSIGHGDGKRAVLEDASHPSHGVATEILASPRSIAIGVDPSLVPVSARLERWCTSKEPLASTRLSAQIGRGSIRNPSGTRDRDQYLKQAFYHHDSVTGMMDRMQHAMPAQIWFRLARSALVLRSPSDGDMHLHSIPTEN